MIPYFDGHRTAFKHLVQFHQTHVSTFFFFFLFNQLYVTFCIFRFFFFFSLPMLMLRHVSCTFIFVVTFF